MTANISRRDFLMLGGAALVLSSCVPLFSKDKRPNFVIIMADDQRYDTMQWMPQTQALIFDHGITFSQSISPTPLCCPARACTFTGLYAHNEGVYTNLDKLSDKHETVFMALHDHGYYTGLVGKYLLAHRDADQVVHPWRNRPVDH